VNGQDGIEASRTIRKFQPAAERLEEMTKDGGNQVVIRRGRTYIGHGGDGGGSVEEEEEERRLRWTRDGHLIKILYWSSKDSSRSRLLQLTSCPGKEDSI
jgi:hypothetical protein